MSNQIEPMFACTLFMHCPKCNWKYEDFDGFGVLHCEHCGYCTHSSITNGTCDFCGAPEADAYEAAGERHFRLPGGGKSL